MSAYEDFKGHWQGQEGSLCSIAISLKRIADKLTADDQGSGGAPLPAGPAPEEPLAGPVVNGSVLRVGDRVRLRSGIARQVVEIRAQRSSTFPWEVSTATREGTLLARWSYTASGGYALSPHPLDLVDIEPRPESDDDSQPDGPVVDGRTVKVGDRVRLRSGDVLPVVEVMRYPDCYYPWQIRHYADRRPELYGHTGRQMPDGFDHHNDIVGFVDEPEAPAAPAPVDLSQLRPGDAIRLAGGRLWLVREVGPVDDGYYVTAVDAWIDRLHAARYYANGLPMPSYTSAGPIVEIIKGKRDE